MHSAVLRYLALICAALALPSAVQAHLMPKQNGTMKIAKDSANFVISVPVSILENVDDDADGFLSPEELGKHSDAIAEQFGARFKVTDGGQVGQNKMTWVLSPLTDDPTANTDYVVVMHRVFFPAQPRAPNVSTDLFGTGAGEAQLTIRATRGDEVEAAILRPGAPSHQFFLGSFAQFADFVRIGVEHIWGGIDHLLFLLTIVVAGASWRYWLGVVTSFTIAHSITLTLSALDMVRINAALVEPGIAFSIVLLAVLNLVNVKGGWSRKTSIKVAIVFACGLLHGFGFASAIGEIGLGSGSRFATLAGFNVGIEIGQFIFVAALLVLAWLVRRIGLGRIVEHFPKIASILAAILGTIFFFQRIMG